MGSSVCQCVKDSDAAEEPRAGSNLPEVAVDGSEHISWKSASIQDSASGSTEDTSHCQESELDQPRPEKSKACGDIGKAATGSVRLSMNERAHIEQLHSALRWGRSQTVVQETLNACPMGHSAVQVLEKEDPQTGNNALHIAAQNGHLELVRFILDQGVCPCPQNKLANTPMHMSVEYDYYFVTKLLLDRGAERRHKNEEGHEAILGIGGGKTGTEAWDYPIIMLKAATSKSQLDLALTELEKADAASLDKGELARIGLKKAKECKANWDKSRFMELMRKL